MFKAAFFDIDGTLFSHQSNSVPASTLNALHRLRDRGVRIFLATGRSKAVLEDLPPLRDLPWDGAITLNGAYCYDHELLIHHDPIPREDICALLEYLEQHPTPCAFIEADRTYMNYYCEQVCRTHEAIHTPLLPLGDLERGKEHPVYQVLLYRNEQNPALISSMPHSKFAQWHNGGWDVFSATAGKAAGIQKILAHYGVSRSEAIAFGDAENDLDMFGAVRTSVAMGNASPEVKAAASYITAHIDDNGIFKALTHLGLI